MLPIHILSFGFVIGVTAIADKEAFAWIRGKKPTLDHASMRLYHTLAWVGLLSATLSGIFLLYPLRVYLLANLLFDIKLLFVAILFVNAILIGRLMNHAVSKPFKELTYYEMRAILVSGVISTASWLSSASIAFWLFS